MHFILRVCIVKGSSPQVIIQSGKIYSSSPDTICMPNFEREIYVDQRFGGSELILECVSNTSSEGHHVTYGVEFGVEFGNRSGV